MGENIHAVLRLMPGSVADAGQILGQQKNPSSLRFIRTHMRCRFVHLSVDKSGG